MPRQLKHKDIPIVTQKLLKHQKHRCPLCDGPMLPRSKKNPALDHDHGTGFIRSVLCINCNGIEGKIHNLVRRAKGKMPKDEWLMNLFNYWKLHETPQYGGVLHPTHKTEEQKRLARNAKARKRRAAKK